jgi:hypothetical protein
MFPFAGFGKGLARIGIHIVFYSMGIALPITVVVVYPSGEVHSFPGFRKVMYLVHE